MMEKIKLFIINLLSWLRMQKRELFFKKEIKDSYKKIENHNKLSNEQKDEIQQFYQQLIGRKIPLIWHEYFYSRTGHYSKEYVPISIHHCEIMPRANDWRFLDVYNDKNLTELFFPQENIVHTILKNMRGYFYYEGKPVTRDEAIALCSNLKSVIIKPSRMSQGRGVELMSVTDGITDIDGLPLSQIFEERKENYMIQECVKQHKDMAALNPSSVNTIRIVTYRSNMEVLVLYSVIRIGRKGEVVDNQSAGGISTTIDSTGRLSRNAFGGYSTNITDNAATTDTGIVLEGYQVPSYDKAIAFVKRLHLQLPFFDMIGWDVAIQEDGEPVLIEFNNNPQLSQSAFGSGYGEYTERIIREVWPRENTRFPIYKYIEKEKD